MLILLRHKLLCCVFVLSGCTSYSPPIYDSPPRAPIQEVPKQSSANTLSTGPTITQRASLGVVIDNHTRKSGAYIMGFEASNGKSPAEVAGLQKFDIITKIDSCEITNISTYFKCLESFRPFDTVKVLVERAGNLIYQSVKLGGRK